MHLRILDKYIFREVTLAYLFGICAFTAVFIGTGTLFRIAEYITDYGASFAAVVKIFIFSMPAVVIWTFPMSMLVSSLLTYARLSGNSEITAMKSCGVSFFRIAAPAIVLGGMVSIFAIGFNEYVVPWANTAYRNVLNYEIQGAVTTKSQEHIIIKQMDNGLMQRLAYARRYDADTQQLQGVTLQEFSKDGKISHVENAEYADWNGSVWTMHNGMIYDIASDEKSGEHTVRFKTQTMPIEVTPKQVVSEQKELEELTMRELSEQIDIMRTQYVDTSKLETEFHQRVTIPMASLVFALVGVPLGLQPNRHTSAKGFAISVVIIFAYYALMTIGNALARSGSWPPMLAVWMPNVVSIIFGALLIRKASR